MSTGEIGRGAIELDVEDEAEVQGRLVGVRHCGEDFAAALDGEDGCPEAISLTAPLAGELATHIGKPVRLHGRGTWLRRECGQWALVSMKATAFELLVDTPLVETLHRAGRHLSDEEAADLVDAIRELRS